VPAVDALLDTDVLVEVLRGRPEAVAWLSSRPASTAGVPVIVWMELIQGARDQGERDQIVNRLVPHSIIHLETGDSQVASAWFAAYWLSHRIGILDCLIAAIAVRLGVTLYTFNTGHSQVIPGLHVQSPYERPQ
jgi:predicted nucleic acid-binding protein